MDTPLPTMNPEVARLRRLSEQRKLRKRLRHVRLLWTIAGGLLFILLLEVLIAVTFSSRFQIYRITTLPTETLTQSEIIRLLALPAQSNYYRVSLSKLEDRLKRDPRVESARVKHGVLGTLRVEIHERQAVCQVQGPEGPTVPPLYMDRQGYLFTRPLPPTHPVMQVEGLPLPALEHVLGQRLTDPITRTVLQTMGQFSKIGDDVLDIAQLRVNNGLLDLRLRQGTLVHVGLINGIDLPQQARYMMYALTAVKQRYTLDQIAVIDISHVVGEKGKGIVYTPKTVQEATTQP